jgi:hypothetical protein
VAASGALALHVMYTVRHERWIGVGKIDRDAVLHKRAEKREVVTVEETDHVCLNDPKGRRTGNSDVGLESPRMHPDTRTRAIAMLRI